MSADLGTCSTTGKMQYASSGLAARHARALRQGVEPYRCRFCRYWHVGHDRLKRDLRLQRDLRRRREMSRRPRPEED